LKADGPVEWEHSYGGSGNDFGENILQDAAGNFLIAGSTDSMDGDVGPHQGESDFWLVKLDATGNMLWQNTYGGNGAEAVYSLAATSYKDSVLTGSSIGTTEGTVSRNPRGSDDWVVKVNASGTIQWEKSFRGSEPNGALAQVIRQTKDRGLIIG